jgi:energy-coupling factor transport system substrate-specific component
MTVIIMKLRSLQGTNARLPLPALTTAALCSALLVLAQIVLAGITNVELVSLLVILFTLKFGRNVLYSIYTFVLVEGLIYGFHLWWISYLYIWAILAAIVWLFRRMESPLGWAVLSGAFGLAFGALCAIPYLFAGGVHMAAAYWVSGIPFDLLHCAGNFLLCLLFWKPLRRALQIL